MGSGVQNLSKKLLPSLAHDAAVWQEVETCDSSEVGYLPDGTPMNRAGNAINHPETIGPDPHAPGFLAVHRFILNRCSFRILPEVGELAVTLIDESRLGKDQVSYWSTHMIL